MKPLFPLSFMLCLFVFTGCGSKTLDVHSVEGVVTLDGEPFADVTVSLFPTAPEGSMGFAVTDAQGKYRISTHGGASQKGTTLGTYQVALNKLVPDGRVPTPEEQEAPNFDPSRFSGLDKSKDLVPKKYQLPNTSGFEITVGKGENVHNFGLLSK
jgi:hypothetical protein